MSLWFYYYCSIERWCNWPRKAIWVKMEVYFFFFLTSKQQKVKRSNTKMMPKAVGTGILEIIFRNTTIEENIYLWLAWYKIAIWVLTQNNHLNIFILYFKCPSPTRRQHICNLSWRIHRHSILLLLKTKIHFLGRYIECCSCMFQLL